MKVFVIEFHDDDPKKCTSRKMLRFKKAISTNRPKGIVLNPYAKEIISKNDINNAIKGGITIIDSSWNKSDNNFYEKHMFRNSRRLPFLLAGNPVNYAKPMMLSSIEAVFAALYILGFKDDAAELLALYKWMETFVSLNSELLDTYSGKDENDIREVEREVIERIMGEPRQ
ncbi:MULTISPECIES: DUF367 family protein [Acidianus]|uniref:16S rRNA aminocarboxypropyltransferase n=1 Tax=Candidatus Acidianus copahuensis TaxID=1160895 RepID=A0A031LJU7_9CREN|nr:hypothetical protein CM19_09435 [Candidatus Acidianus copahuensis]NON62464.1 DUF367 family protein [Acidianus sp. RZ1]